MSHERAQNPSCDGCAETSLLSLRVVIGERMTASAYPYRSVGRYRVCSELASGGMATVHLGCLLGPAGFSKLVAIKCLHDQLALEKEFVSMFLDEARLASSIHHPNVVATLDVVAENGELLVVMEYVHGETLAGLCRAARQVGELPAPAVVVRILCDALDGLHAAHVASLAGQPLNIVHRDVSPQNIMVGADGNTRVLDFGIAQAALSSRVTAAGVVKGKIAYMSPEQLQGQAIDARTDIFAAGVVLWEALTGRRLFLAADSRETMAAVLRCAVAPPSSIVADLPPALDGVVLKALERDPERRFQNAHDFAEALRGAAEEGSRREVADWVGKLAKDGLARRLELLQALEASTLHTPAGVEIPVLTSRTLARAVPGPETTQTQATSITSVFPSPEPERRHRWAPWVVAAGGLVSALVAAALRIEDHSPSRSSASVTTHSLISAATTALPAKSSPAPEPPSNSGPPPLAAESLPLAPEPTSPAPQQVKARKPASAAGSGTTSIQRASKSCNPPYRIDAAGVRRIKPECL
jgi:eukaryotic-like serine/threonine-protein kinase